MTLATNFALAVIFAFGGGTTMPVVAVAPQPTQTVREYVHDYFSDIPIMIDIAFCESTFRQYNKKGEVHRGVVNNQDVGVMQVNERFHLAASKKLDFDIYTVQGNVAYSRYLYEKEGTTPWNSSSPCWKPKQRSVLARN